MSAQKMESILRRMESLMKAIDDEMLEQFNILLDIIEHTGSLPFKMVRTAPLDDVTHTDHSKMH